MDTFDVIVIGAGASGLMCAIGAAGRGRRTAVLDLGRRSARKVRIAGGGRCNFTNLDCEAEHYLSENPHFCKSALSRFTPWDIVSLLAENGLSYEEKAPGQLFCAQGGGAVAGCLERMAGEAGASLYMGREVRGVEMDAGRFVVRTGGETFSSASLVVATGGRSWPGVGATSTGYEIATRFGVRVVPPRPALAPLVVPQWSFSDLAGVSFSARVSCGRIAFTDDVLITHKGLSGPAVLQISSHWRKGEELTIDLLSGGDVEALLDEERATRGGRALLRNVLSRHVPGRLAEMLIGAHGGKPVAELNREALRDVARRIGAWTVMPSRTEGWEKAEVTAGGVDTAALSSKTMGARGVPGLFFTGEVQDVTGRLGGYNLQWAWSSGFAAGEFA
ncbi:hypothetical protein GGQ74_000176 [Desulfobaculum xiamenense]|uniref:Aminoacetone oxidase family FAD-binding enzyme n=1 Tax=Desulfobaculum xiamenense TaxID=995050 RepID=A0A846QCT7_9BACT|nr:NAD(P)/FAD-dependent oxidoreductase [Desulfobaculum xiamenense]NJB66536.1 hypothetical protein [Desulfobaculum xiamenense]